MSFDSLQPALHDLVTCLHATTVALSRADGQIEPTGALGLYCGDLRVLSNAVVSVDARLPESAGWSSDSAGQVSFVALFRHLGNPGPDPTVWLHRARCVSAELMTETLTLENASIVELRVALDIAIGCDLAKIENVRAGLPASPKGFRASDGALIVTDEAVTVRIVGPGADISAAAEPNGSAARMRWDLVVAPRSSATVQWSVSVSDPACVIVAPPSAPTWKGPDVRADDWRLAPWIERSIGDLTALRATLVTSPDDEFLAAGSPWYLTLFGRDSIWAARMMLPLGTDVARGTLRSLASLQGTKDDPLSAEEPGKILHELRRGKQNFGLTRLPPVYYGTIDASPLWVCLLTDAWRWGMAADDVEELLPAAERALSWMLHNGDQDGDGFLEYVDRSGHGLANQGWKDSGDSIRNIDGSVPDGPIALAEVQGYAYEAALGGAALLDAFGRPGASDWRHYAAEMAKRFRRQFWVADSNGRFPAVALDGDKRPVPTVASNMGHLLGTGLLDAGEARLVADRLTDPTMASGFGLRTMSSDAAGYSPMSYHCGSVWPHDTAIAIHGLAREGLADHAAVLCHQLTVAASAFGYRLPELYSGFSVDEFSTPLPYPASCRPQAWAAAAAVVVLQAALGLEPDVPNGVCRLAPTSAFGALDIAGLQVAGEPIRVRADSAGAIVGVALPAGVRLA